MVFRHAFAALLLAGAAPAALHAQPAAADAEMRAVLAEHAALTPRPIGRLTPEQARREPSPADAVMSLLRTRDQPRTPEPVARVEYRTIPGPGGAIPVKLYTPMGAASGTPLPVVVYYHGGGFVIATVETYDSSARAIANAAGAVVMSVEYRKGPEHRFPAAHDDAFAAYEWALANAAQIGGDPARVAVAGESAGGNLAAATAMTARERGVRMPVHQLLVYPVVDNDTNTPSYRQNAAAAPLNRATMQWFFRHYTSPAAAGDMRLTPLRGRLAGLPSATVITAQIDPLRSEGEAYAQALRAAGVEVDYAHFDGVAHEFFGMGAVHPKARAAVARAGQNLRRAFGTATPTR